MEDGSGSRPGASGEPADERCRGRDAKRRNQKLRPRRRLPPFGSGDSDALAPGGPNHEQAAGARHGPALEATIEPLAGGLKDSNGVREIGEIGEIDWISQRLTP
jgi:hypothetical protein